MPGPSAGGNIGGPSSGGNVGGTTGTTNNSLSIKNLPELAQIKAGDFMLVETPQLTTKLNFSNFIVGKENITFAGELIELDERLIALTTQVDNITALFLGGTGQFNVGALSSLGPITAVGGIKIGTDNSYIKNVGGFYSFSNPVSSSINFHTSGGNSHQWSTTYSSVFNTSGNWNSSYTSVNSNSSSWNSTHTDVYGNSGNWTNTYSTVNSNSAAWGGGSSKWTDAGAITYLTSTTDKVTIGDTDGDHKVNIRGSLSASNVVFSSGGNSGLWESTYTTVKGNSSSWGSGGGGGGDSHTTTTVAAFSSDWTYTATNSADNVAFDVTNNGTSAYRFNNGGFTNDDNPTLHLIKGQRYKFRVNASGHPFYLKTTPGTGTGNQYTDGVTNNGAAQGNVDFVVQQDAPDIIYYQCQVHSGMNGKIYLGDMVDYAHAYTTTNSNSGKWEQTYSTVTANSSSWSTVTAVSGGIALVGETVHLADPETLTQIAEADTVAADRMLIWDESVSSWKYITIEDLQDEIDTGGGGGGEANEYSFKTVTLSSRDTTIPHQSDIIADTTTDTLTLCAGPNIELIGDSTTDTVTISARDVQGGSGSGAAERIYKEITQSNSFSVGNAVYIKSDGAYDKAKANAASTADVVGIITAATGSNFTVTYNGEATVSSHGFTVGAGLFLSSGTAGALTETSPTGTDISKPVGVVKDANTIIVATYRGLIGSGAGAGGGGGSGHTIQYDGSGLTSRTNLNFVSTGGVTDPLVADDSGNDASKVTMPNGFDIMMISEVFR